MVFPSGGSAAGRAGRLQRACTPTIVLVLMLALLAAACAAPGSSPGLGASGVGSPSAASPGAGVTIDPNASASGGPATSVWPTAPSAPESGTWVRVALDGPAPAAREDHTWTVDEAGASAYLFAGRDGGTVYDDLWRFDFATEAWHRVSVTGEGPASRFGHEGVWVPGRGLVVWAGQSGASFHDDLWLFHPQAATWQRLPASGLVPVARYGSCSGLGPDGRLWISHGFTADGARFADTAAYDFAAGTWTDEAPSGDGPVERCLHACWWTPDGRLALYGGQTTGVPALGDLWFLTPGLGGAPTNTWAMAASPAPVPRQLAAVARRAGLTVVFGGRGADGEPLSDTWLVLDGASAFVPLEAAGDGPRARSGAALVYERSSDRFLLFGGLAGNALDDVWELRLQ